VSLYRLPNLFSNGPGSTIVALRSEAALTLDRFRADIGAAADNITERDIRRGALICDDAYWFAVGLFGLFVARAEVVIPPNAQPGTLSSLAEHYDAIVSDKAELSDLPLAAGSSGVVTLPSPDECHIGIFTSGSTGIRKRIAKTLAQFEHEAAMLERHWGPGLGTNPVYATVSPQHVYGLTFRLLWPLIAGRPFSATTHEMWEDVLGSMRPGAILISSPTHLTRLQNLEPLNTPRQPAQVFTAGAPLPATAAEQTHAILGVLPTEIYGSTETGALATRQQTADKVPWQALKGVETDTSEDGRLRVRALSVDPDSWTQTEDMIEFESPGRFSLLGRADRVVKVEGKRVSLAEIETLLCTSEWVADAAAIMLPGDVPVLAAAVVLTAAGRAEFEQRGAFRMSRLLRRALSTHLDGTALPRRWRFVESIAQGPLGKRTPAMVSALFQDASLYPEIRTVHRADTEVKVELTVPHELFWLRGHFPGYPVLPGVAQLHWVVAMARDHLELNGSVTQIHQLKFRTVIRPDDDLTVIVRHIPEKSRIQFEYRRGDEVCSTGQLGLSA
jgi:3-hydroxymyristoyl/3-hydroxydecanoyl-(acyl carrier protein) dehydratase